MAFTEDFSEFFDTEQGFAVTMVVDIDDGLSLLRQVAGIYDEPYFEEAGEVGIEMQLPVFVCSKDDVPGIAHGDSLTNLEADGVFNTSYERLFKVVGVKPDGTGLVELALEDQANAEPIHTEGAELLTTESGHIFYTEFRTGLE